MKFLFREEDIGMKNWNNRKNIIGMYKWIKKPFVNINKSCGISKADFEIMLMELKQNELEVKI